MVKIFSLNCNGLREPQRVAFLKHKIENLRPDILFLQETHVDSMVLANSIESKLDGKIYWSLTNNRGKGVAIYINKSLDCRIENFRFDSFGRYVYLDAFFENHAFRLVNVYTPTNPKERKEFFNNLYPTIICARPIILGGDFNCVSNLALDKQGGNINRGKEGWQELSTLIQDFDLVDAYRSIHPIDKEYTWSRQNVSCRLDRFYVSKTLLYALKDVRHVLCSNSDHKFVTLTFSAFNHINLGKPYWKINNALLQDEDYVNFMNAYLHFRLKNPPSDTELLKWWDEVKMCIKEETIAYTKKKRRKKYQDENKMRQQYAYLEKQGKHKEASEIKDQILDLETEQLKGAQIRSKVQVLENGEKPTKFFLRKELLRGKKKIVKEVINLQEEKCNSSETILTAFKQFYEQLYKAEPVDSKVIEDLLQDIPQIGEEDAQNLGRDILKGDIKDALKHMNSNKSPGSDGLSKEFYSTFFESLAPTLIKIYKTIHTQERLSPSQQLSYITVISKDKNNPEKLSNYRPISLLNVDYKILTNILSQRLKLVLDQIIHPDQTCAVPGRSIIDNCHLIRDIINYGNDRNMNGILLSLDQEKAFDRISHTYLFETLQAFGIGEDFITWIKALYTDITSCVIVNHMISDHFPVSRSVRQGCSLSPLLYVICLEPILNKIRNDPNIKGFKVPSRKIEQKVTAFADDGNFFLSTEASVERILRWFEYFGRGSGSKLNKAKSTGHFFGKWKNRSDHPFGISWAEKNKIFGIWFGNISEEEIWKPVHSKICKTLNLYRGRLLSVYGRAMVVNTMLLSKVWYMATILKVPDFFIKLIEKEMFTFIWNSTYEPIKRATLYLPKIKGGIGLTNIRLKIIALQLTQACKIVHDDASQAWVPFGHIWLGLQLIKFKDYAFSNTVPHCIENIPPYYQSIIENIRSTLKIKKDLTLTKGDRCKVHYLALTQLIKEYPKVIGKFPQIDFQQVFSDVSNGALDPATINVSFKIAHDVLPVAYRLYCYNMPVIKWCSFCKKEIETVEHLFYYCPLVQQCKQYLAQWFKDIGNVGISLICIRFSSFNHKICKICHEVLLILLAEYRFAIWQSRNKARFDNKQIKAKDIAACYLTRVRNRVTTDFHRKLNFRFENQWAYTTICKVNDNKVVFNFR
jgi:exonuclease III